MRLDKVLSLQSLVSDIPWAMYSLSSLTNIDIIPEMNSPTTYTPTGHNKMMIMKLSTDLISSITFLENSTIFDNTTFTKFLSIGKEKTNATQRLQTMDYQEFDNLDD